VLTATRCIARNVQSVERSACRYLLARNASAERIEAVIIDVEADFICCFTEGKVQAFFNGRRQREIGNVAAADADYVMVMFSNTFG